MLERWKKDGNHSPPNNKLVQDSQGNEENGYPVPDLNKTKIDYTKEPNKEHPEKRNHWGFHRDVTR
jgi:hypothetical protein